MNYVVGLPNNSYKPDIDIGKCVLRSINYGYEKE
jgi:hypothetical protein